MVASEPYVWQAAFRETLGYRSSPQNFVAMDFVVKVVLPNGHTFYVKGSETAQGYYKLPLALGTSQCVNNAEEISSLPFYPGVLEPVAKN